MAETTTKDSDGFDEVDRFEADLAWRSGALAGVIAALLMGLVMGVMRPAVFESIAGLYGFENQPVAGWIAHVIHGGVFGLLFAFVLADPGLARVGETTRTTALAGLVFGIVLAVVAAGIIMPMWLGVIGFADPPSLPNVTVPSVIWHAVYGLVLGSVFSVLYRRPS